MHLELSPGKLRHSLGPYRKTCYTKVTSTSCLCSYTYKTTYNYYQAYFIWHFIARTDCVEILRYTHINIGCILVKLWCYSLFQYIASG